MQNTIVKEFENNPQVFAAVFQQGGQNGETREWLEVFWSNYFLRGGVIWDETGTTGGQVYGQPSTHLPFGRGFIIDQEGRVSLPYFGHQPQMAIDEIYELLGTSGMSPAESVTVVHRAPRFLTDTAFLTGEHRFLFELARPERVTLAIYDVLGRELATLLDAHESAGRHAVRWSGLTSQSAGVPGGVYYAFLRSPSGAASQKLLRLR